MNTNQKGFANIILIIVIVAIIAVGGYFVFSKKSKPAQQTPTTQTTPSASTQSSNNQPTPTSTDKTASWKTFRDDKLKYEFQYPPFSCEVQREMGDTSFVACYLPKGVNGGPKGTSGAYSLTLGFISQAQLNVMGVTYCAGGAYLKNDPSRCESIKIGGVNSTIDWGINVPFTTTDSEGKEKQSSELKASVWIPHPNGGIVTFELQPIIPESKAVLYEVLSTFKFLR